MTFVLFVDVEALAIFKPRSNRVWLIILNKALLATVINMDCLSLWGGFKRGSRESRQATVVMAARDGVTCTRAEMMQVAKSEVWLTGPVSGLNVN